MVRLASQQAMQKMRPGTLGGQSWAATPVAQHKPHRQRRPVSQCPRHIGHAPTDYGTLRLDASEIWFPTGDIFSYPGLSSLGTFSLGGSYLANRGAMTRDNADVFYVSASTGTTHVILAVDGPTQAVSVVTTFTDVVMGLVWHPYDGMLYAISVTTTGPLVGSFWQVNPSTGASTLLVAGPLNGHAAPTNFKTGTDNPLVVTEHYVVTTYDQTQAIKGIFAWDVVNGVYGADATIANLGWVTTGVTDEVIGSPVGGPAVSYIISSPGGVVTFTPSNSPLKACPVFSSGFFDNGWTQAGSATAFNDGGDIYQLA